MTIRTERSGRVVDQLIVLLPTLAVSAVLGALHVPVLPRVGAALGLGMMLIVAVTLWKRRRS